MQNREKNLGEKAIHSLTEEGIVGFAGRTKRFVRKRITELKTVKSEYKDVLFISGCNEDLPHPWRYRVKHQREQLEAYHFSTDEIYFRKIKNEYLRYYRAFVFFRCPYTEQIGNFIEQAKKLNKKLIYDIDDLVIDTKYTDQIPYVRSMASSDKEAYDENVNNMKRLLQQCDMVVTTTNCLADELKRYSQNVYINRNRASEKMIQLSQEALNHKTNSMVSAVRLGYFSGSITHNADLEMIMPVLTNIMDKYSQVILCLVGELDLPEALKKYEHRIESIPFSDWRKLPEMIASVDINLAPLKDTIFNRAKSENKWVEAALVKVVTIASDVGAFHDSIENGKTGVLCRTLAEWEEELCRLIEDQGYRFLLAEAAYSYCMEYYSTIMTGNGIADIFQQELNLNYAFILPSLEISGGIKVALKHAAILQSSGKDVLLILLSGETEWYEFEGHCFPVISLEKTKITGEIGCAIATMWTTVKFVETYPNIKRKCYLVQNFETNFYAPGDPLRVLANQTYMVYGDIQFLTISKWCQKWLQDKYRKTALYAPNGLETDRFLGDQRCMKGKIRILIEGDCSVAYKNVDEAFKIIDQLNLDDFEVWYMSYKGEPQRWYHVDRFLNKIPYEQVPEVYAACDILLKTSLLESFSYPPLEMMASGGYVVAVPNGGNAEYMQNEYNCLLYPAGNIEKAKEQIERLCVDEALRNILYINGIKTAKERQWKNIENNILQLYGCERL